MDVVTGCKLMIRFFSCFSFFWHFPFYVSLLTDGRGAFMDKQGRIHSNDHAQVYCPSGLLLSLSDDNFL